MSKPAPSMRGIYRDANPVQGQTFFRHEFHSLVSHEVIQFIQPAKGLFHFAAAPFRSSRRKELLVAGNIYSGSVVTHGFIMFPGFINLLFLE